MKDEYKVIPDDYINLLYNVKLQRDQAEEKAWKSLAGYKFSMFGYWAAAWVKYNQLLTQPMRLPNPFKDLVHAAREHIEEKS